MPNLSASDYTRYLKYKAAALAYNNNNIPRPIQTVDQIAPTVGIINSIVKTSEASFRVNPTVTALTGLARVRPMPPYIVNHPKAKSSLSYPGMGPATSVGAAGGKCCGPPVYCPEAVDLVIDTQGQLCECSDLTVQLGCPGFPLLYPFECPRRIVNIRFNPTSFEGTSLGAFIVVEPTTDVSGVSVTIDGNPATIDSIGPGAFVFTGSYTTSSVIVITFPTPIGGLGAFCPGLVT